ncbi:glutamate carboxypeptidase 2-like [Daphnia pulex]|uniref:glutamate carboxypeptidase 2-like n=1 Tax=Daphnia pulex TaxID=6669 RepID=UPI001EDCAD57|nr:glutamate carboxypeptidase 2-like [Daphnia pulex]XP_046440417.1 glutamate carboxypeptidase 2-like [Daphnia pulex]XP_046440418.1 glutamate carboxypeptidase 2-like [Daphnia pulex]XP_046440419.1 glutamate carboxypeptidase 2-like [Daphnia pulex]
MAQKPNWILICTASVICLIIGILIGRYAIGNDRDDVSPQKAKMSATLMEELSASNIGEYLKYLSSIPNLAGTPQDLEVASWVRDRFVEGGLDEVQLVPYKVLLSYPDMSNPNQVSLLDSNGKVNFTTSGRQTPLFSSEEFSPLVQPNFNAYSANGTVEGELIYANYGRKQDFEYLKSLGIDIRGRIVIARYGAIFRGNIVKSAEDGGALGVILFSDPKDFAPEGRTSVYPNTTRLPGMAVQSGSVLLGYGDPLTPLYPALEGAYRLPEAEAPLPKIPVQPIGYDEAEVLLRSMSTENPAPEDWQGGLNATYFLGSKFTQRKWSVRLQVRMTHKLATAYNTIGILYGREEPDRYVLVGNHMDSWTLGGIDPASGTSVLIEMARTFGNIKMQSGWRPRRTLMFCGWGAEEYGMIGSYEWAEEHAKVLIQRAVAYINVDSAMEGNYTLKSQTVPSLYSAIREAAKVVPNPNPAEVEAGRKTVFDTWLWANPDLNNPTQPRIGNLGSGSDYTVFSHVLGVPCVDLYYDYQEKAGSYPLYHTLYETYHAVANLMDPGFHFHLAVARLMTELTLNLSESVVLPFDVVSYASFLEKDLDKIESRYKSLAAANGATFEYFRKAVAHFRNSTEYFTDTILPRLDRSNPLAIRKINDQLIQLERGFVDPHGLPGRPEFNHIVFAPSSVDKYSSDTFAGLVDLFKTVGNRTEQPNTWRQIKQHLSAISFLIGAAADSLREGF